MSTVSTSAFYNSAMASMAGLQARANTLQAQIASGSRLQASSDDPVAAAQLRGFARIDASAKIDVSNSNTAQTNLNLADTALTSITNIVQNIQTLATQAASSTVSDSQRANIGTQIATLQQNLVSLANSRDASGNALFGGETAGPAYSVNGSGNAAYVGTASAPQTSLGSGLTVTSGVTGPQVFDFTTSGTATDLLSVVKTLGTALQSGSGGQAAAQTALAQLSDGLNAVSTTQTMVGARLVWIDTTNTIRTQLTQQRTQQEANVGGTDITSAVTRLQQTMTALQASQASFVKLSSLSLFSLIQ
jgi:flagellar hook-associated protein 3 FlgL